MSEPKSKTGPADALPVVLFEDAASFERWLEAGEHEGVWVKFAKKGTGVTSMTYAEAVDVALCMGWIDGQSRSLDETFYLQRFTPRRKKSIWSRINVEKVERLIAQGRMKAPGLAEVERAKADGRWAQAVAGPAAMEVPNELVAALAENDRAQAAFDGLDKTNRYALCYRVATAVKAETRIARARKAVEQLVAGDVPYPASARNAKAAKTAPERTAKTRRSKG